MEERSKTVSINNQEHKTQSPITKVNDGGADIPLKIGII